MPHVELWVVVERGAGTDQDAIAQSSHAMGVPKIFVVANPLRLTIVARNAPIEGLRHMRHDKHRATRSRQRGGSDHTSFNEVGLPGIGVQQDPIEYTTATWHTNLDTYERIIENDAKQSAMAIATAAAPRRRADVEPTHGLMGPPRPQQTRR